MALSSFEFVAPFLYKNKKYPKLYYAIILVCRDKYINSIYQNIFFDLKVNFSLLILKAITAFLWVPKSLTGLTQALCVACLAGESALWS